MITLGCVDVSRLKEFIISREEDYEMKSYGLSSVPDMTGDETWTLSKSRKFFFDFANEAREEKLSEVRCVSKDSHQNFKSLSFVSFRRDFKSWNKRF